MKAVVFSSGSKSRGPSPMPSSLCSSHFFTSRTSCSARDPVSSDCVWPSKVDDSHNKRDKPPCRTWIAINSSQLQPQQNNHHSVPKKHQTVLLVCSIVTFLVCSVIPVTAGIDCFKCVSLNGNNPSCEDPFHNNYSISILESPCMGGRKGRNGMFPATACIKLAGTYYDTGATITVRGCALDSGTLNVDTEIIRMSHCGHFWFDDRYVKGCLQSCDDADGCNGSSRPKHFSTSIIVLLLLTSFGFPAYFLTYLGTRSHCGIRVT